MPHIARTKILRYDRYSSGLKGFFEQFEGPWAFDKFERVEQVASSPVNRIDCIVVDGYFQQPHFYELHRDFMKQLFNLSQKEALTSIPYLKYL
jgi:hypothetical protein